MFVSVPLSSDVWENPPVSHLGLGMWGVGKLLTISVLIVTFLFNFSIIVPILAVTVSLILYIYPCQIQFQFVVCSFPKCSSNIFESLLHLWLVPHPLSLVFVTSPCLCCECLLVFYWSVFSEVYHIVFVIILIVLFFSVLWICDIFLDSFPYFFKFMFLIYLIFRSQYISSFIVFWHI